MLSRKTMYIVRYLIESYLCYCNVLFAVVHSQDDNLMKTFLLILMIFTLLIIASKKNVFAQNITTGNATAKSSVTTNINGSADVYTKIEVEANEDRKVLETSETGTHTLGAESNSNANVNVVSSSENNGESTEGVGLDEETKIKPAFVMQKIFETISQFFKKFLSIFS